MIQPRWTPSWLDSVVVGKLPTPKVNSCLHMDIRYSTFDFTRIYQDPSMKIPSWMAIGRGKEANAYKYPLTFLKWWSSLVLKTFTVSAETIPSPNLFPLLTNPASKLELPQVQTIPLLEQFKTVPPPSTISNHLKESIRVQILITPQNLEDLDQVSPQESCFKSSDISEVTW